MAIKRRALQALADSLLRKPSALQEAFRLFIQDHPRVAELKAALAEWVGRAPQAGADPALSDADRDRLRALGYIE